MSETPENSLQNKYDGDTDNVLKASSSIKPDALPSSPTAPNEAASTHASPLEAGPPSLYGETRPSCMECVEKHIGAAMVLLSETKNGYLHYLLAVGHLHEAEEESQAWLDLAAAIRAARKELQTSGMIPVWDGIMGMMEANKP